MVGLLYDCEAPTSSFVARLSVFGFCSRQVDSRGIRRRPPRLVHVAVAVYGRRGGRIPLYRGGELLFPCLFRDRRGNILLACALFFRLKHRYR